MADDYPPWLDSAEAAALLKDEFNVTFAARTIDNKCYRGDIPYEIIAGQRRIPRDGLREWARPPKGGKA